ncbi:MAG: sporulation transcriptional regulator SpoIIID [Oscillospiraceae bacterium]|nr:sporulation transcriptional regulator SpoIIID [Oscillospiraceae bacterium]
MNDIYTKYLQNVNISRCEALGRYIADTGDTVRGAAKVFGVSKSTVHKDITKNLKQENYTLFCQVAEILKTNKQERHIRGGLATRDKYINIRQNKFDNTAP